MKTIRSILVPGTIAALLLFFFSLSRSIAQPHDHAIPICGDEEPGAGLPSGVYGLVDRFNRPWIASDRLIKAQIRRERDLQGEEGCSRFRIDFEDVIAGNGIGFDDRTEIDHPVLGRTTRGALRRRTVCEVFAYIESVIDMRGNPDILIRASQTDGGGFLAAAGPFFVNGGSGYDGGTVFDHITTGDDPTPEPGNYDGTIIFDFGYAYHEDWSASPGNRIDLFSVTLHEITHALGFLSLIRPDGSSAIGGQFSLFDKRLREADGTPMIDPATSQFRSSPTAIIGNALLYQGELCGDPSPVYSPAPYRAGSSLSHFDSYRSGIRYVMRPATGGGEDRRYTMEELQVLCELGYTLRGTFCNGCAPRGTDDFANTMQGVEVCIDVTANDINRDGGPIGIDPASIRIITGGGDFRIRGNELCYTPSAGFVGLAVLEYAPTNGAGTGSTAKVYVNVMPTIPPPPSPRKDYLLWYFGELAGLSFGSGVPVPLTDGALSSKEGCAVISDPVSGRLLFYTNGVTVWNSEHTEMPNGTDLIGNESSSQSALIVPIPDDPDRFYIFTTSIHGLRYSIVDMRLDGGKGEVTEKNAAITAYGSEKLAATRHCNGRDYWVVTHEIGSDAFLALPVTPSGIGAPVVSHAGSVYQFYFDSVYAQRSGIGYLKISPDAKRIATANTFMFDGNEYLESGVELFDFDNATGVVSNGLMLDRRGDVSYYGVEFSQDNSRLYATSYRIESRIFQWDLAAGDSDAIVASRTVLPLPRAVRTSALQIGPDGRIYMAADGETFLGIVTDPNKVGTDCNLVLEGIHLQGRKSQYGLPNLITFDLFDTIDVTSRLRLTKILNDPNPHYNDTISYTIRVCNERTCGDAYDVRVEDILPDGLDYVGGFSDYPFHLFDTIPPGECRDVVIRALVGNRLPVDIPVTNCARLVDVEQAGQVPGEHCATFTLKGVDVGIAKSVSADSVNPGDPVTFTVVVTNYGAGVAGSVVARDLLPAGLTYLSHSISDPDALFDPAAGTLTIPLMEAGRTVELTLRCTADEKGAGAITNCAEIVGLDQSDLDLTNNRSCASVYVRFIDMAVTKTADPERPLPGSDVTYTITIANNGTLPARDAVVTEVLPAGLIYLSHTLSDPDAAYNPAAGTLTIPLLLPGETVEMVLVCRIDSTREIETITNCVGVAGITGFDPDEANDRACITVRPRWCRTPELTVRTSIPHDLTGPVGKLFTAPLRLEEPIAGEPVPRLRVTVEYDPKILILENWSDASSLTAGTLLEGWNLAAAARTGGMYEAEFTPPNGIGRINGTGTLLNLRFRMFLGWNMESALTPTVSITGNPCVAFAAEPGRVRIDSLCGLSLRLIELTAGKYAVEAPRPNPFTGSTDILFSLGLDGETTLVIHDLSGRTVATPVKEYLAPGSYSVTWDASDFPPGLYFYTLTSGAWFHRGELLLVK